MMKVITALLVLLAVSANAISIGGLAGGLCPEILEVIQDNNGDFTYFNKIMDQASDVELGIESADNATIIVPTDEAFGQLFESLGIPAIEFFGSLDLYLDSLKLHFIENQNTALGISAEFTENTVDVFGSTEPVNYTPGPVCDGQTMLISDSVIILGEGTEIPNKAPVKQEGPLIPDIPVVATRIETTEEEAADDVDLTKINPAVLAGTLPILTNNVLPKAAGAPAPGPAGATSNNTLGALVDGLCPEMKAALADLSILNGAIQQLNSTIVNIPEGQQVFIVAPKNTAFVNILGSIGTLASSAMQNPNVLGLILKEHILVGVNADNVTSLNGNPAVIGDYSVDVFDSLAPVEIEDTVVCEAEGYTAYVVDGVVIPEILFAAKAPSPGAPGRAPGMAPAPGPSSSATSAAFAVAAGVAMVAGLMA